MNAFYLKDCNIIFWNNRDANCIDDWNIANIEEVIKGYELSKKEKTTVFRFVSEASDKQFKTYECSHCKKTVIIPYDIYIEDYRSCLFCRSKVL